MHIMKRKQSTNIENKLKPELRLTKRGKVVAGVMAGLALIGAGVVGKDTIKAGQSVIAQLESNIHQSSESDLFSRPTDELSRKLASHKGIAVTSHIINTTEANPTDVARDMGAIDIRLVAGEVSDQVGNQYVMQDGQRVIIPNDQLKQPTSK